MSELLLPYAYNKRSERLVRAENATKQENANYVCPNCGNKVTLRISKKTPYENGYKRPHFAHIGHYDNYCSESILHKFSKDALVDFINEKITCKKDIFFKFGCDICGKEHNGNLINDVVRVVSEYDLGVCRPDIALLNKDDEVVAVVEIIVMHAPTIDALKYYKEHNILCLQINIYDFEDCDNIEVKLTHPTIANNCDAPFCKSCYKPLYYAYLFKLDLFLPKINTSCYRCGNATIGMLVDAKDKIIGFYDELTDEAKRLIINKAPFRFHQCTDEHKACNAGIKRFYEEGELPFLTRADKIELGYMCLQCKQIFEE